MTQQKGFTLVELLVAVGIIGVLASVSLVSINSVRAKARDAKRISEIQQMQKGLEAFYSNNGSYPFGGAVVAGAAPKVTLGDSAAAAGSKNVTMCNTDNDAVGEGDEYGGYGFADDDTINAPLVKGDGTCRNQPFMKKINKDPSKDTKYEYQADTCATKGNPAVAISPCAGYTLFFSLEGGTGSFNQSGAYKATPNGIEKN